MEYHKKGVTLYFDENLISLDDFIKAVNNGVCNQYLHKDDGPALVSDIGAKIYYIKGQIHCEDGPAVVYNTIKEYYLFNIRLEEESFQEALDYLKANGPVAFKLEYQNNQ